jgi:hypothetical protein
MTSTTIRCEDNDISIFEYARNSNIKAISMGLKEAPVVNEEIC